jgi:hypothetical protein
MGAAAGLLCAWAVLAPFSQCLIDYDDDDVVLYTVRYFRYAAAAVCVICSTVGAVVGREIARFGGPAE